jgi:hypothetical protein
MIETKGNFSVPSLRTEMLEHFNSVQEVLHSVEDEVHSKNNSVIFQLGRVNTKLKSIEDRVGKVDNLEPLIAGMKETFVSVEKHEEFFADALRRARRTQEIEDEEGDGGGSKKWSLKQLRFANQRLAAAQSNQALKRGIFPAITRNLRKAFDKWVAHKNSFYAEQRRNVEQQAGAIARVARRLLFGTKGDAFRQWREITRWESTLYARREYLLPILQKWRNRLPDRIDKRAWLLRWRRQILLIPVVAVPQVDRNSLEIVSLRKRTAGLVPPLTPQVRKTCISPHTVHSWTQSNFFSPGFHLINLCRNAASLSTPSLFYPP